MKTSAQKQSSQLPANTENEAYIAPKHVDSQSAEIYFYKGCKKIALLTVNSAAHLRLCRTQKLTVM